MVTDSFEAKLTRGPRGWRDHWAMLLRDVERLRGLYAGTVLREDTGAAVDHVHKVFLVVDHMRDWVTGPAPDFPTASRPSLADLASAAGGDECLTIANALNNTAKHRERSSGMSAWVREVVVGSEPGVIVRIEHDSPAALVDALELADRCILAWGAWFRSVGEHV